MSQCIFMFFAVLIKFKSTARIKSCLQLYHFSSSVVLHAPTACSNVWFPSQISHLAKFLGPHLLKLVLFAKCYLSSEWQVNICSLVVRRVLYAMQLCVSYQQSEMALVTKPCVANINLSIATSLPISFISSRVDLCWSYVMLFPFVT